MENKSFVPDNIPADLKKSWQIPRPTLARTSHSSQGSTSSSNNSTQSAKSGSLLLTAANLAQIQQEVAPHHRNSPNTRDLNIQYYLDQNDELLASKTAKEPQHDNISIASSTHFTVVNMNNSPRVFKRSYCRQHQLTILVVSMSVLFTIGVLAAVYLLEVRARLQRRY